MIVNLGSFNKFKHTHALVDIIVMLYLLYCYYPLSVFVNSFYLL